MVASKTLAERFEGKTRRDENGCLIWTGGHTTPRKQIVYGLLNHPGAPSRLAHRAAWFLAHGEWPAADMDVDHLCNVTLCVEPSHLEVVSRTENNRRRRKGWTSRKDPDLCAAGLHPWGPDNWYMKGGYPTCRRCELDRAKERYHAP